MASPLVAGIIGLLSLYAFLLALLKLTHNAREPAAISTSIPFIGPLLEMGKHKARFHPLMRDQHTSLPIYTLRLPFARMYIINSAALVAPVQRLYRTLSFAAIEAQAAAKICNLTKEGNEVVQKGLMKDDSYTGKFGSAIHPALTPGENLDAMNRNAVQTIAASLDRLQASGGKEATLFEWVRDEIVLATSDAVYGPHNPLRDPEALQAWYRFEAKIMTFAIGILPNLLARNASQARHFVTAAILKYFEAEHHLQGSALVQCRVKHSQTFGFSLENTARAEVGGMFAVLGSTGPACFWMIYHLYSDPEVLADCRREVQALVQEKDGHSSIDVTSVKSRCPILLSTLQEVLRFRHIGVSARVVLEDETLDGRYHLQKGSTLMMPTTVYHSDPVAWGPTVSSFNHRRFLTATSKDSANSNQLNKAIPKSSYRPFGGGVFLCPGRHFATTEILAFAALVIARFDITPTATQGWKTAPTIENSSMVAAFPTPDDYIGVKIQPREVGRKWRVELVGSDRAVGISVEDIEGRS